MKLEIRNWPDPGLLAACSPWTFDIPPIPALTLEQDLIDTMLAENALGLAANQVGVPYRVFAMHVQENSQIVVMYNPMIKHTSQEQWVALEGCLSFPGVGLEIERPRFVTAQWQDRDGKWSERLFSYVDAKCFLHELDHLDGKVFKDLVSDLKFQRAKTKAQKR